jgi:hypothetical protein
MGLWKVAILASAQSALADQVAKGLFHGGLRRPKNNVGLQFHQLDKAPQSAVFL